MKLLCSLAVILYLAFPCGAQTPVENISAKHLPSQARDKKPRRFFSDDSFWNKPLPANPD